jgi:hypothetical protein
MTNAASLPPPRKALTVSEKDPLDLDISAKVMEVIEHHADEVLKASGSALRYFTLPAVRRAILLACLELHNEAFVAGIAYAKEQSDG